MRLLRHKNGGGKIDETSEACAFSLVDRDSVLQQKTSVWSSALENARVSNSVITGGVLKDARVFNSRIAGGSIEHSVIAGAELVADYALVKNSVILDKCRIVHTARVENCQIKNFTVGGNAELIGWSGIVDGQDAYIMSGTWRRPPRILYLDGGLTVTESVPGFAFCGCREYEISHWLKIGDRYGARLGLSADEVEQIRQFLLTLQ